MPQLPPFPGVYVESGSVSQQPIAAASTSVAVFLGEAVRGPVGVPVPVDSMAAFTHSFGDPVTKYDLGFAAQGFFANGGGEAWCVRVAANPVQATLLLHAADGTPVLQLTALDAGDFGNCISVSLRAETGTSQNRFQLTLATPDGRDLERYDQLSMNPQDAQFVETVLRRSNLVQAACVSGIPSGETPLPPPVLPSGTSATLAGGSTQDVVVANVFATYIAEGSPGLAGLRAVDTFNLLALPGIGDAATLTAAAAICEQRDALLVIDAPFDTDIQHIIARVNGTALPKTKHAALYYPYLSVADTQHGGATRRIPPSGAVLGVYARTDAAHGVWKSPAGLGATISGAQGVEYTLTDQQNGMLNPLGVNCIRRLPGAGTVVWGARTLCGSDASGSGFEYVSVSRMTMFLKQSLSQGLRWVVFEPNDEALWSQVRLQVNAFLLELFRQGAFAGATPEQTCFVRCDSSTTTPGDQASGVLKLLVGFAPLRASEFVVLQFQQIAGQTTS